MSINVSCVAKTMFLIIIISVLQLVTCVQRTNIEGYYWREFAGVIPTDALPGGTDHNGFPIYIGQVLYDNKLLTAILYVNDKKGYFGVDGKENTDTNNIKILCTQHPEQFEWILTKNDEIHKLTNHHVILGGHEPGYTMYIGRVFYKLKTLVGKVSTGKTENLGLYITHDGSEINLKSFEILTYNPTSNTE